MTSSDPIRTKKSLSSARTATDPAILRSQLRQFTSLVVDGPRPLWELKQEKIDGQGGNVNSNISQKKSQLSNLLKSLETFLKVIDSDEDRQIFKLRLDETFKIANDALDSNERLDNTVRSCTNQYTAKNRALDDAQKQVERLVERIYSLDRQRQQLREVAHILTGQLAMEMGIEDDDATVGLGVAVKHTEGE